MPWLWLREASHPAPGQGAHEDRSPGQELQSDSKVEKSQASMGACLCSGLKALGWRLILQPVFTELPLVRRAASLGKTLMLGKTEGRRRGTEDEMVGWHHQLNGHEFEQAPGVGDGQRSLGCCSPRGHKEAETAERLNYLGLGSLAAGGRQGRGDRCSKQE